jgi:quercetin 2,3-dioxygenase
VYLAAGTASLEGAGDLHEGDAVRLTGAGSPSLTAGSTGLEVLIWTTNSSI